MKRTLLAWLGLTDLRASRGDASAGLGPIGQAVEAIEFAGIVLLSNLVPSENDFYRDWLQERVSCAVTVEPVALTGPTNFGEIYEGVIGVIEKLRRERAGAEQAQLNAYYPHFPNRLARPAPA